jgi:hypothetical protein
MLNKKVKDKRDVEYILIQFIVHEGKIKGILETADGKFFTEEYHNLRIVR